MEGTLDIEYNSIYTRIITPLSEEASFECDLGDIGTIDSVDSDDALSYHSDDTTIYRARGTTFRDPVWDISTLPDDDTYRIGSMSGRML